ncbi:hypothetical protein IACHDJAJ_00166 [Aeromonas phage vB_AdhS_TS3]|nr:hypothetical protein IACHDJAJ_00166 [Aeromonas phage vB_AdhS_TS3]
MALIGGTLSGTVNGTRFTASDQYAFVSSNSQYHGIFLGTGTDKRIVIGGGDVASGTVNIRPRGISTVTNETVFNNDGTITGGGTPTLS